MHVVVRVVHQSVMMHRMQLSNKYKLRMTDMELCLIEVLTCRQVSVDRWVRG